MCLIVFAWDTHPKYKLILAANRDEFYERPTAQANFWSDHTEILAGRDLKAHGTWMGVSKEGKFGAVTNYRDLTKVREETSSRGEIVTDFLKTTGSEEDYLKALHNRSEEYNGFNVLVGSLNNLMHYSNYERKLNVIQPGIHGLSNALLDTNWRKVEKAKQLFGEVIDREFSMIDLIAIMSDTSEAEDFQLPDTGVSRDLEKSLSAMCIRTEKYGTCCTTAITMDRFGVINFVEKSYPVGDRKDQTVAYEFNS